MKYFTVALTILFMSIPSFAGNCNISVFGRLQSVVYPSQVLTRILPGEIKKIEDIELDSLALCAAEAEEKMYLLGHVYRFYEKQYGGPDAGTIDVALSLNVKEVHFAFEKNGCLSSGIISKK